MSFYLILSRSTAMAILKVMDDLEAVKKDDSVTPSEQLVKKSQSLQRLVKGSKIPTPLQLLVKEMPGQTLPHFCFSYRHSIKYEFWRLLDGTFKSLSKDQEYALQ